MRLSNDVSRCAGNTLEEIPRICAQRESCKRYIAFKKTDEENGINNYASPYISVMTMMCADEKYNFKI